MRLASRAAVAFAVIATLVSSPAFAQVRKTLAKTERVVIYANGAYQTGSSDVQSTVSFSSNLETGTFTSKFRVKPKAIIDAGGHVRVWKNLSVGAGYTSFSTSGESAITAQVPHPFFFGRPRTIEGTAPSERKETTFHLRAVVTSTPGRKLQFSGFAGPAFFSVEQTLVDRVSYSDAYPFDTATFTSATTRRESTSKTGFGAGADVSYFFIEHVGVGLSASYSKITYSLKAADDSTVSISAGGAIVGLGARIRF